jgi:hypothetical protein
MVTTGTAVAVDPAAEADRDTDVRTLIVGSDVALGETVVTGTAGQVQLVFTDETKLAVGPNSKLLVEAYLLRDDKSVGQFTVDALSGSFRFITGKSDKSAYLIKTATGMIGVRGTAFDFDVTPTATTLVLFNGAVHFCNLAQKCVDLAQHCGVASVGSSGSSIVGPRQQARRQLRGQFQWVQSDTGLLDEFRLEHSSDCLQPVVTAAPVVRTVSTPKPPKPPKPTPHRPHRPVVTVDTDVPVFRPPHRDYPPPSLVICPPGTRTVERDDRTFCLPRRVYTSPSEGDPGLSTYPFPTFGRHPRPRPSGSDEPILY